MKQIRSIFFFLLVIVCLNVYMIWPVNAETRQEKKLVYVVLDNSGSMHQDSSGENRWEQSLYALEVLSGLLNPEDRMELFYLNSLGDASTDAELKGKQSWTADLSKSGLQSTIDKIISVRYPNGGTRFQAVKDAFQKMLVERKDYDKYWLVAITDGEYVDSNDYILPSKTLRSEFESFVNTSLGRNDEGRLQLIYLTIGTSGNKIKIEGDDLENKGIYCYDAKGNEIVETMGQIANRISGRSRIQNFESVGTDTIRFSSDYPLFNFVVLLQGTDTELTSAVYSSGTGLNISRGAEIKAPLNAPANLRGGVYTVDNGSKVIEAGTYTLVFDRPVQKENVTILVEPALEIRLTHILNGLTLSGEPKDEARVGDSYGVLAAIFEAGSNREYGLHELPGAELTVRIDNGQQHNQGEKAAEIRKIEKAQVKVTAVLSMDNFTDIVKTYDFTPKDEPVFGIRISPEKKTYKEAEFKEKGLVEFTFTLRVDNKDVNAEDYDELEFSELNKGIPLNAVLKDHKWVVSIDYDPTLELDKEYVIQASFRNKPFQKTAVFTLNRSEYEVEVKTAKDGIPQSELSGGILFEIRMKVDKHQVLPDGFEAAILDGDTKQPSDQLTIDPATDVTDPNKKVRTFLIKGSLLTEAKQYILELKNSAGAVVNEYPFTVILSVYDIQAEPNYQMVFSVPEELIDNTEEYRFEVRVDGRELTPKEMNMVTSCSVVSDSTSDAAGDVTTWTVENSAWKVFPKAPSGWAPSRKNITYTITCEAPENVKKSVSFSYSYIIYSIVCTAGDGKEVLSSDLRNNTEGLSFRVYGDEGNGNGPQPLPFEKLGKFEIVVPPRFDKKPYLELEYTVEKDGDGGATIHVIPKTHIKQFWNRYSRVRPITPSGDMQITLRYKGKEDSGTLKLVPMIWYREYFWWYLTIAILIYLIGLITTKRFHRGKLYYCRCEIQGNRIKGLLPWGAPWPLSAGLSFWMPYGHESTSIQGLRVRATDTNIEAYIGKNMIVKKVYGIVVPNEEPDYDNPEEAAPFKQNKWKSIRSGEIIVVYRGDNDADLYSYRSSR